MSRFIDTDSYVKEYKDAILDDDEIEAGNKILDENVYPNIQNKLKLVQAKRNKDVKANATKKALAQKKIEADRLHYYDKMADDIQEFKLQEQNTRTSDGKVRYASDNFKFTDVETTTQNFVQKKQAQYQEEQQRLSKI